MNATNSSLVDEFSSFVVGLQANPIEAFQTHPNVVGTILAVLALPILVKIVSAILKMEPKLPPLSTDGLQQQVLDEVDVYKKEALDLKSTDSIWTIGVSNRAVSISDAGVVRVVEFTKDLNTPSVDHIIATFLKAAVNANYNDKAFNKQKPNLVVLLETSNLSLDSFELLKKELDTYGVKILKESEMEKNPEQLKKWKSVASASTNAKFISAPDRGCYVCKKDIVGKASQCGQCKAIIYCSLNCSKKDWPSHKPMCQNLKKDMEHIKDWKLHHLPFSYYNEKTQLCNYNQVNFLISKDLHNIGLFRRLCGCFNQVPYGGLAAQMIAEFQAEQPTPEKMFAATGLPQDLFPLSKAFDESVDVTLIDSWDKYMKTRGYPLDSPGPLIMEVPLTIWHIINKFYLKKKPLKKGERRQITIHLLGPEKEADLLPLFECILPFFPNCELCIHMIGPMLANEIQPQHRAMLLKSVQNNNSLFISMNPGVYSPQHFDASAFKLPPDFPKEMLEGQNFGQETPDLIIALNASLLQYQEWAPTLKFLFEKDAKIYVTDRMENIITAVQMNIHMVGGQVIVPVEPNPFKQPIYDYKKDVNLPGWSNGFLFALGKKQ